MKAVLLLALLLAGQDAEDAKLCAVERSVPADVQPLLGRWAMCNHWGGEEPYDAARRREINRAVRELKCDRLEADEARLRAKYKGSAKVASALDRAKESEGWPDCRKTG